MIRSIALLRDMIESSNVNPPQADKCQKIRRQNPGGRRILLRWADFWLLTTDFWTSFGIWILKFGFDRIMKRLEEREWLWR